MSPHRNESAQHRLDGKPAHGRDQGLEHRYGPIGISSVAAAARYQGDAHRPPSVSVQEWLRDDANA